jgi:hypothetical protein
MTPTQPNCGRSATELKKRSHPWQTTTRNQRCPALIPPSSAWTAAVHGREGVPPITERGDSGFVTAAVLDPFGNILGVMYNPHYLEILRAREEV